MGYLDFYYFRNKDFINLKTLSEMNYNFAQKC